MEDEYQRRELFESKERGIVLIGGGRINKLEYYDAGGEVEDFGRKLLLLRNLLDEEIARYEKSDERRK